VDNLDKDLVISLAAIICLTAIAVISIYNNIDSFIVTTIAGIIGGIAGYKVKSIKVLKENKYKRR